MARVTVEDCVVQVPNRFELVLLAAQRAREITSGAPLSLDRDDDKNPVVALREIAEEKLVLDHLQDSLVRGMQKHVEMDEPEETPDLDLDQTIFGVAEPTVAAIAGEVDEEAADDEEELDGDVAEELEEDMLNLEEEEVDPDALPPGDADDEATLEEEP